MGALLPPPPAASFVLRRCRHAMSMRTAPSLADEVFIDVFLPSSKDSKHTSMKSQLQRRSAACTLAQPAPSASMLLSITAQSTLQLCAVQRFGATQYEDTGFSSSPPKPAEPCCVHIPTAAQGQRRQTLHLEQHPPPGPLPAVGPWQAVVITHQQPISCP